MGKGRRNWTVFWLCRRRMAGNVSIMFFALRTDDCKGGFMFMDLTVQSGGKTLGRLKEEYFPVFQYFLRECGFDVRRDSEENQVLLEPVLSQKKVALIPWYDRAVASLRNKQQEKLIFDKMKEFLERAGVTTNILQGGDIREGDFVLQVHLAVLEIPQTKDPLLEMTLCTSIHFEKMMDVIRSECKKCKIKARFNTEDKQFAPSVIKIRMMSPVLSEEKNVQVYAEKYASVITNGLLSKLLGDAPLSVFSLLSVQEVLKFFSPGFQANRIPAPAPEAKRAVAGQISQKTRKLFPKGVMKKAEVYFDYHFLVDHQHSKVQIFGSLHIKNTGTAVLRNPVICLKFQPGHQEMKMTGQILPKNYVETKAVVNREGVKGWQYLKENWFEDFEQKGELWICPIHELEIVPGKTESLSNLQISYPYTGGENVTVDAYVYFSEDGLEYGANNRISWAVLEEKPAISGENREEDASRDNKRQK